MQDSAGNPLILLPPVSHQLQRLTLYCLSSCEKVEMIIVPVALHDEARVRPHVVVASQADEHIYSNYMNK
jgi:hypothetical protein